MATNRPLITLEEHFISEAATTWSGHQDDDPLGIIQRFPHPIQNKLTGLSNERLQDMDAGSVTLQVISHGPANGSAPVKVCRKANDELKSAVDGSKGRFAGFAMIPMDEPAAAAAELERCVKTLGFVGALVNNHERGRFYDDIYFWPVFSQCHDLDVPIYLHPTVPGPSMAKGAGNYPDILAQGLDRYCWGWHSETGVHILRLFASGLFDEYPKLKIIIGHMGEMLPFMLDRIMRITKKQWPERKRGLQMLWDENLYITTAGMFAVAPMACLLRVCRIEHIMYSVDYPFSRNEDGKEFLEELAQSGLCSKEEMNKIAFGNAEQLLKIEALR